ncbi:hypothetical protein [Streptomyces sp.]|uniref:hypothetical protein n=1 Tax=Streptomyces sp. TaxID=1931 RepID=UPI002F924CBE
MIAFEVEPEKPPEGGDFLNWLEERDRAITECASRPSGHRWQIEGEPGEEPFLSCQDCPAGGDDLFPDIHVYLTCDEPEVIGDREVPWGRPLPDDMEPYVIPVNLRIEARPYTSLNFIGTEYDIEIRITERDGESA